MILVATPENLHRFWSKVDLSNPFGCWLWLAGTKDKGYGAFWVDDRMEGAHRVAWELTRGPIPDELCVLHSCDNPPCVNPTHLFLGTILDNNEDMLNKGRNYVGGSGEAAPCGEAHWKAVLTDAAVLEIRRARRRGDGLQAVADRFDISLSTASQAATGAHWAHLDAVEPPVRRWTRGNT